MKMIGNLIGALFLILVSLPATAGHNSLHDLVSQDNLSEVEELLQQKKSKRLLKKSNSYNEKPIHLARSPEMVHLLAKHGAKVDAENRFDDTALLHAVARGDVPLIEALLEAGADPNHKNRFGDTPLQEAVWRNLTVITNLLVQSGASVDRATKYGGTVLHIAVRRGNTAMVTTLLQAGADAQVKDRHGHSATDLASSDEMREVMRTEIWR